MDAQSPVPALAAPVPATHMDFTDRTVAGISTVAGCLLFYGGKMTGKESPFSGFCEIKTKIGSDGLLELDIQAGPVAGQGPTVHAAVHFVGASLTATFHDTVTIVGENT